MDWQQIISLAIVAAAAGMLLWSTLRRKKFSFQRDTHCGCSSGPNNNVAAPSIIFRARKGHQREIHVKMN
jgi:hypothetical protein